MKEIVRKLGEASNWAIPEDRMEDIAVMYKGTMEDTRPVRELDLGSALPAHLTDTDPA